MPGRFRAATLPEDFQGCFHQHFKSHQSSGATDCTLGSITNDTEVWHDQLFERLKTRYPNLVLIDQRHAQCSADSCTTIYKGAPIYRDIGHMSDCGSCHLGQLYLQVGNVLIVAPV